jgi:uncharacterized repeat protein (TIGR01451 family)
MVRAFRYLLVIVLGSFVFGSAQLYAAQPVSLGTPTPPSLPTTPPEPSSTQPPTVTTGLPTATPGVSPTATPGVSPTATPGVSPTVPPGVSPTVPPGVSPTVPPAPRPRRQPEPSPTPELTLPTPVATATPEPWLTEVVLTKQVNDNQVLPGDVVQYTLLASNTGSHTAFDVVVTDQVDAQLEVIDLRSGKGDIVLNNRVVTAYIDTLEPGERVEVVITVRVRAAATGRIPNIGTITTSTEGDGQDNNTSLVEITVRESAPRLSVAPPPSLPITSAAQPGDDVPLLTRVPPIVWVALVGILSILLGGVVVFGLRRTTRVLVPTTPNAGAARFTLPSQTAGPPRLGPALPPPASVQPLPPLVPLQRDDVLRDVLEE